MGLPFRSAVWAFITLLCVFSALVAFAGQAPSKATPSNCPKCDALVQEINNDNAAITSEQAAINNAAALIKSDQAKIAQLQQQIKAVQAKLSQLRAHRGA